MRIFSEKNNVIEKLTWINKLLVNIMSTIFFSEIFFSIKISLARKINLNFCNKWKDLQLNCSDKSSLSILMKCYQNRSFEEGRLFIAAIQLHLLFSNWYLSLNTVTAFLKIFFFVILYFLISGRIWILKIQLIHRKEAFQMKLSVQKKFSFQAPQKNY